MDIQAGPQISLTKRPGTTITTATYSGDYDTLKAAFSPAEIGQIAPSSASNNEGTVTDFQLTRQNANLGTLRLSTVTYSDKPVWGVQWQEITKPIITHPLLTDDDRTNIRLWQERQNANKADYDQFIYDNYGNKLTGNALLFAQKIINGTTDYAIASPIITKVTRTTLPTDVGAGLNKIAAPTGDNKPTIDGTWQWRKTDDDIQGSLEGIYTRTERWQAAHTWDADLYQ